jgi:Peptidase M15
LILRRIVVAVALAMLVASCTPATPPTSEAAFQQWLAADVARAPAFRRFEAMLVRESVDDVVPSRNLWLTDRLAPECVVEPFAIPPEEEWPNVVPALRFIRDHVKPAIGEVTVASGYRDPEFNKCVGGAPRSAHRGFYALDLLPAHRAIGRKELIAILCPLHAREGRANHIGMGIYRARRFHIDALRYRGWGEDFHAATFPCTDN